jgi:hypothetical protein
VWIVGRPHDIAALLPGDRLPRAFEYDIIAFFTLLYIGREFAQMRGQIFPPHLIRRIDVRIRIDQTE